MPKAIRTRRLTRGGSQEASSSFESRHRLRIGIPITGGAGWIGGAIYVENLIHALRVLDPADRPEIKIVSESAMDGASGTWLGCPILRCRPSLLGRVARRLPKAQSLAAILYGREYKKQVGNHIDVLFPCQQELASRVIRTAVAWIPDFQHIHLPQYFSRHERRVRDRSFSALAAYCSVVVLSSKVAAQDFARQYPKCEHKGRVLPFAIVPEDHWYEGDAVRVAQGYGLPETYLMVANQFWMHKNHRCVFDAMAILRQRGRPIHVVCTGATADYRNEHFFDELMALVRLHQLESQVYILGLIPRVDQVQLLRRASAVVQPSLFEGWSTVVEDVRVLGKRLFVSDIPVHREQNVDGAVYFDPNNPTALADVLESHMSELQPGPDLAIEATCRVAQGDRVLAFARNFMTIADEVWALAKNF